MKPESSWIFAIEDSALAENSTNMVFPKGLPVLLIKKTGQIYALSNKCAHMACALAGGTLKDYTIKCPCHDWRFDIRTGEFQDAKEIKIPVYEWKLSDGKIFIKI
ncbi:MAG TPA: Rieske (2Fe-2S) protein [Candidatus Methanoperedens sp.]